MIEHSRLKIQLYRLRSVLSLVISISFFSCGTIPGRKTSSLSTTDGLSFFDTTKKHVPLAADVFLGEVRADVKTSYVNAIPDTFESIKKLRNWLPDDEYMHKYTDAKHNNSPRTKEENHNVYLYNLFIFGVKREDDNDFHVILGSSKSLDKEQAFFSAEISGLPDSSSSCFAKLSKVRSEFLDRFGEDTKREFLFVASEKNPPIPIDYICGSLFFDNHHYGGHSSVQGFKVCSAWEIHPVTAIRFHKK